MCGPCDKEDSLLRHPGECPKCPPGSGKLPNHRGRHLRKLPPKKADPAKDHAADVDAAEALLALFPKKDHTLVDALMIRKDDDGHKLIIRYSGGEEVEKDHGAHVDHVLDPPLLELLRATHPWHNVCFDEKQQVFVLQGENFGSTAKASTAAAQKQSKKSQADDDASEDGGRSDEETGTALPKVQYITSEMSNGVRKMYSRLTHDSDRTRVHNETPFLSEHLKEYLSNADCKDDEFWVPVTCCEKMFHVWGYPESLDYSSHVTLFGKMKYFKIKDNVVIWSEDKKKEFELRGAANDHDFMFERTLWLRMCENQITDVWTRGVYVDSELHSGEPFGFISIESVSAPKHDRRDKDKNYIYFKQIKFTGKHFVLCGDTQKERNKQFVFEWVGEFTPNSELTCRALGDGLDLNLDPSMHSRFIEFVSNFPNEWQNVPVGANPDSNLLAYQQYMYCQMPLPVVSNEMFQCLTNSIFSCFFVMSAWSTNIFWRDMLERVLKDSELVWQCKRGGREGDAIDLEFLTDLDISKQFPVLCIDDGRGWRGRSESTQLVRFGKAKKMTGGSELQALVDQHDSIVAKADREYAQMEFSKRLHFMYDECSRKPKDQVLMNLKTKTIVEDASEKNSLLARMPLRDFDLVCKCNHCELEREAKDEAETQAMSDPKTYYGYETKKLREDNDIKINEMRGRLTRIVDWMFPAWEDASEMLKSFQCQTLTLFEARFAGATKSMTPKANKEWLVQHQNEILNAQLPVLIRPYDVAVDEDVGLRGENHYIGLPQHVGALIPYNSQLLLLCPSKEYLMVMDTDCHALDVLCSNKRKCFGIDMLVMKQPENTANKKMRTV